MPFEIEDSLVLRGGLGNILFQLAAGLKVSRISGRELEVLGGYSTPLREDRRLADLVNFLCKNLGFKLIVRSELPHAFRLLEAKLNRANVNSDQQDWLDRTSMVRKRNFITGYFQSWRIFQVEIPEIASLVRDFFRLQSGWTVAPDEYSMHLRLGDYSKLKHIYGTPSLDYLVKSIRALEEQNAAEIKNLKVFTNDSSAAIQFLRPLKFEWELSGKANQIEDLMTMSNSRGIIGSNSTFSWWSAAIGNLIPITLPKPFLLSARKDRLIDLGSPNVIWIDRSFS